MTLISSASKKFQNCFFLKIAFGNNRD